MSYAVVDVGTTGVKLLLFDGDLEVLYSEKVAVPILSEGGRVEQSSEDVYKAVRHLLREAGARGARALAITTYRGSVVAWDRRGKPLTNVITWMDERGAEVVAGFPFHLKLLSRLPLLRSILSPKTPVVIYKWIFSNLPRVGEMVARGEAYLGTLDSYLVYRLTGRYVSDATNAALTGLLDPRSFSWMSMPGRLLGLSVTPPELMDNVADYGDADGLALRVVIADQQAASIGECCVSRGCCKVTHGTGTFVDVSLGGQAKIVGGGLVPLVLLRLGDVALYGVEGFVPATGLQVDWLVKNGFYSGYGELDELALRSDPGRLVFIPGFAGMRVPELPSGSGVLWGLSLNADRGDVARAVFEGISFAVRRIVEEIEGRTGVSLGEVRVDGGLARSDALLRVMADVLGVPVLRQREVEVTARGAAMLLMVAEGEAGLGDLASMCRFEVRYEPGDRGWVDGGYERWLRALDAVRRQL